METQLFRLAILKNFGATDSNLQELLDYNQSTFEYKNLVEAIHAAKVPEPHVETWQNYSNLAAITGAFSVLSQKLVQLQFPIKEGISQVESYQAATKRGVTTENLPEATGLALIQPDQVQLFLHETLAGPIPVILVGDRQDFVTLIQALTKKNEPLPVPESMGACIVGGYNNWDRINDYRSKWSYQWSSKQLSPPNESDWQLEFKKIIPQKSLYQDRFIISSKGFYSNVSPSTLGLELSEWLNLSHLIRLEHECTHYCTRRFLNSMRNNLVDELIADYRGLVAATGTFKAQWFLAFMGLERFPIYREGARLENYRGTPPLSDSAYQIVQKLIKAAAENLEKFTQEFYANSRNQQDQQLLLLIALSYLTLEELAAPNAIELLHQSIRRFTPLLTGKESLISEENLGE
ncbi:hypothetical protein H6F42_20005 [Pseudanabaena sp. FACHB-1998]|uniref:DUF7005 family protein n=1 Tax=Pseudanabaena sp. FACHB-1998 TaxID=2692858 RepID=UPI0016810390|nr:hypothetical protein [Pseudanabaena sp. FACHB-1998]MBD2179211.1 hypothetical protein [Pseudanabaena sp. FACHB-1998]